MIQRSRLNFGFLEKGLGIVSPQKFVHDFSKKWFSCYILLTDQISLSDCLYYLKYWSICVFRLFVNQVVTLQVLKLALSFWSICFYTWPKSQDKNLNILRTERAFEVKQKAFFVIFKGLSVVKSCLGPESVTLMQTLEGNNSHFHVQRGVHCTSFFLSMIWNILSFPGDRREQVKYGNAL